MHTYSSLYQAVSPEVEQAAANIKLLICDVDGVFSDGLIYMGNQGEEFKTFNTKDGFGIKALLNAGITVAVITGRRSTIVETRMQALGIKHIIQGTEHKRPAVEALMSERGLHAQQVAFIGDDVPDLIAMQGLGLTVAPADAHPLLLSSTMLQTTLGGGKGAVRELCDFILLSQHIPLVAAGSSV